MRYNSDVADESDESTLSWRRRRRNQLRRHIDRARARWGWFDHGARAVIRYRTHQVEYSALIVVYRALFLAICVMLGVLYALEVVTHVMPGANEVTIPTARVPTDLDLGAAVEDAFVRSRGAVLDVVGLLTLLLSATYTARAIREGSWKVLRRGEPRRFHSWRPINLVAGLALALVVLIGWLLALATAIRTDAISEVLNTEVPRSVVGIGKFGLLVLAEVVLTLAIFVPLRRLGRRYRAAPTLLASAALAAFTVGANFVLIYTYLGALFDPDTSGGVVLVLAILAWVNIVVRALFYVECWIVETDPPDASVPPEQPTPGDETEPPGTNGRRAAVPSVWSSSPESPHAISPRNSRPVSSIG